MEINYQETTSDLLKRINIHDQYGSRNIDEWMLELLPLKKGMRILDVACGAGKQCFSFYEYLDGDCEITGVDVSDDLLEKAQTERSKRGFEIEFKKDDFNTPLGFEAGQFDLVSCCFAIYYAEDIPYTISEMHRVLKSGGKLFTTGPMPENKQIFYEIIKQATGKVIPPMPGSSRYSTQILDAIRDSFSVVTVEIFENPLTFKVAKPFLDYSRASLSEDRKLWKSFFTGADSFENVMKDISDTAESWVKRNGELVMTKVVGGFIATK